METDNTMEGSQHSGGAPSEAPIDAPNGVVSGDASVVPNGSADQATPDLPLLPRLFWSPHPDFDTLATSERPPTDKVLDVLGPPPFPKAGFPFVGFLATVYDHVTTHVRPDNGADGE